MIVAAGSVTVETLPDCVTVKPGAVIVEAGIVTVAAAAQGVCEVVVTIVVDGRLKVVVVEERVAGYRQLQAELTLFVDHIQGSRYGERMYAVSVYTLFV